MKVRKAVIPAAGFGTRFLPATKAMPKEMLPVIDKPVIQYVVEEAIASGIEDILIVTGKGKHAIEDHFDKSFELEHMLEKKQDFEKLEKISEITEMVDVHYIRQKKQLGLPDAIYTARKHIGDEPFAVLVGDDIMLPSQQGGKHCTAELIETAEKYNASCVSAFELPKEQLPKFGVLKGKEVEKHVLELETIVEKPPIDKLPSKYANPGRYVFTPEFFDAVEQAPVGKGGEKWWPDAAKVLMKTQKIYGRVFNGSWYAVGNKFSFVRTTLDFALRDPDMKEDILSYIKSLAKNGEPTSKFQV